MNLIQTSEIIKEITSLNKRVIASDTPLMVDEKLKDAKLKNLRKLRVLYAKQIADIENN